MNLIETSLPGVLVFEPRVFADARGFFLESYNQKRMQELGVSNAFVQDNHSMSSKGTLRGLHYQLKNPQAKLCRVIRGRVLDVAVDIRHDSPHFGQWVAVELSAENKRQIFVPAGFAHGFVVLSDEAEFLYKCDNFYTPGDEYGVAWDDANLNIDWQIQEIEPENLILSAKDRENRLLKDIPLSELPSVTKSYAPVL